MSLNVLNSSCMKVVLNINLFISNRSNEQLYIPLLINTTFSTDKQVTMSVGGKGVNRSAILICGSPPSSVDTCQINTIY